MWLWEYLEFIESSPHYHIHCFHPHTHLIHRCLHGGHCIGGTWADFTLALTVVDNRLFFLQAIFLLDMFFFSSSSRYMGYCYGFHSSTYYSSSHWNNYHCLIKSGIGIKMMKDWWVDLLCPTVILGLTSALIMIHRLHCTLSHFIFRTISLVPLSIHWLHLTAVHASSPSSCTYYLHWVSLTFYCCALLQYR